MKINLVDYSGEFCSRRTTPGLQKLIEDIKSAILKNEKILISREGVKVLTPSYIDELIPPLMIAFGEVKIRQYVEFTPPLTGYLSEQVERGFQARKLSQSKR